MKGNIGDYIELVDIDYESDTESKLVVRMIGKILSHSEPEHCFYKVEIFAFKFGENWIHQNWIKRKNKIEVVININSFPKMNIYHTKKQKEKFIEKFFDVLL